MEIEKEFLDAGYKSQRIALKALGQFKSDKNTDIKDLPKIFHAVPEIWLRGFAGNKKKDPFPPMRLRHALRAHRTMAPLLVEAWELAKSKEPLQDEITLNYQTSSAEEFEKGLYRIIYDLEEIPLEEELQNVSTVACSDFEVKMALKDLNDYDNYGVGGHMETPTWDDK